MSGDLESQLYPISLVDPGGQMTHESQHRSPSSTRIQKEHRSPSSLRSEQNANPPPSISSHCSGPPSLR